MSHKTVFKVIIDKDLEIARLMAEISFLENRVQELEEALELSKKPRIKQPWQAM